MKNILKKIIKCSVLLGVILCVNMMLTAAIGYEVKLKNADKPFIDLDTMIADSQPGQGGNEETGIENDENAYTDSDEATKDVVPMVISVREDKITINEEDVKTENFQKKFDDAYIDGVEVILVDDYAEYYTYTDVKNFISDKGIDVTEKVNK